MRLRYVMLCVAVLLTLAGSVMMIVYGAYSAEHPRWVPPPAPTPSVIPAVYYRSCDEAKAAGKAPLRTGDPGYRYGLDADHDGIACDR